MRRRATVAVAELLPAAARRQIDGAARWLRLERKTGNMGGRLVGRRRRQRPHFAVRRLAATRDHDGGGQRDGGAATRSGIAAASGAVLGEQLLSGGSVEMYVHVLNLVVFKLETSSTGLALYTVNVQCSSSSVYRIERVCVGGFAREQSQATRKRSLCAYTDIV